VTVLAGSDELTGPHLLAYPLVLLSGMAATNAGNGVLVPKTEREMTASPSDVWAAIIDPHTYPAWLLGADKIRALDADWPQPGSDFHHRVGAGPLKIDDRTTVVEVVPNTRLVLRIRATPLVRATVTFTVAASHGGTLFGFEEEPAIPIIGELVRPLMGPITRVRNAKSIDRLEEFLTT